MTAAGNYAEAIAVLQALAGHPELPTPTEVAINFHNVTADAARGFVNAFPAREGVCKWEAQSSGSMTWLQATFTDGEPEVELTLFLADDVELPTTADVFLAWLKGDR